jgi:excisionase family DNA binding protein
MTIAEQIQVARAQELLTVEQCALLTQMHPYSIYRLISKGKLAVVRVGRSVRIPRAFLRSIKAQPNTDDAPA